MKTRSILLFSLGMSSVGLKSNAQDSGFSKEVNKNAPVLASGKIAIQAKSEEVWNVWMKNVSQSHLNGELEPGTTFDWKAKGSKIHSVLHTVNPNKHVGWSGKAMSILAIHNWTITEVNGTTMVFAEESMEGLIAQLFKRALNKSLDKDLIDSLEQLKDACEKIKSEA